MCTRWFPVLQFINSDGIHQIKSTIGLLNSHNLYLIIFQLFWPQTNLEVLLMEDILRHLGCLKPCKKWDMFHINWWRISSIKRTNTFQELTQFGEGKIKNITPFIPETWSTLRLGDFKDYLWVEHLWKWSKLTCASCAHIFQLDGVWNQHLVYISCQLSLVAMFLQSSYKRIDNPCKWPYTLVFLWVVFTRPYS